MLICCCLTFHSSWLRLRTQLNWLVGPKLESGHCCVWRTATRSPWFMLFHKSLQSKGQWSRSHFGSSVVSRSLQILWVFPFWKLAPRMPPMWSKPSWPWRLKSRKGWGLEPQLAAGRSQMWSWPLAPPSSLRQEDAAEGETTSTLTP